MCLTDDTEGHVDYEDKFTDSYKQDNGPEEAEGEIHEEAHDAVYTDGKGFQEHAEIILTAANEAEYQDQNVELDKQGELIDFSKKLDEAAVGEEQAEDGGIGDFIANLSWSQERTEVVRTEDTPATNSPVSLLSQKHLFWFPSEAFQEEHPVSTNSATQSTQRSSAAQSEESREHDSKEGDHQRPVDFVDQETFYDKDDHHNSNSHNDSHDDDNEDSHQDDKDDRVIHFIPSQHNVDLSKRDRYDDDHYDMGEHEDDRVRYGSQEYDERGQTYDEHESYEDHEDLTDDHSNGDQEHPDASREHLDHDIHDDVEEPYDPDDNNSYEDNSREHVVFSIDEPHNVTQKATEVKDTTDDTWLDGYPIAQKETEQGESTTEKVRLEQRDRGTSVQATEVPNERVPRPFPITGSPNKPISSTTEPGLEQKGAEVEWPGLMPTAAAHPDPSDSHSYSDTFDYDTQQAAPTNSWPVDLTEHPYLDQGPAPPGGGVDVNGGTRAMEEHTIHNLPGEAGERGEVGGEKGEAVCTDENCPPRPPSSSRKGPTVAAIIIAVCVVAAAVIMGVWCYRRQLQKSSVYEMNGKGQNQNRQGQQIEMQQKV